MKKMSSKSDWNILYDVDDILKWDSALNAFSESSGNMRALFDELMVPELLENGCQNVVEIGSAPGISLVYLAEKASVTPFGFEYTKEGVALNRKLFARNDFLKENVIELDFVTSDLGPYEKTFDCVYSFGFIEHFDAPLEIINKHIHLLADRGTCVIVIPNLVGIYKWWNKVFNPSVERIHNLDLMRKGVFFRMVEGIPGVEVRVSSYFGLFDYGLLTHKGQFLAKSIISILYRTQFITNVLSRIISWLGWKSYVSPYQVVVIRKA
jgi:SAM-dependent methyltransferase